MPTVTGDRYPQIQVADLDELRRELRKLDASFPYKVVAPALKDLAEQRFVPAARAEAPLGETGRLRRDIRAVSSVKGARVRVGRKSLPYPPVIHYGWPGHNIEPNPFFERAGRRMEHGSAVFELQRNVTRRMSQVSRLKVG